MKKILVIGILLIIKTQIYSQWVWQNPYPTGNDLTDLKFFNSELGWIVGTNGIVIKTTNSGVNWFTLNVNPKYDFSSVFCIDENLLWATTSRVEYDSRFGGPYILFSSNGGISWVEILNEGNFPNYTFQKNGLKQIYFLNDSTGFSIGDSGLILTSTNSGLDWFNAESQTTLSLERIKFINDSMGFICGGKLYISTCDYPPDCPSFSNGIILKTTDGGYSWYKIFSDSVKIHDIYYFNSNTIIAYGTKAWTIGMNSYTKNFIFTSTNGGQSWNSQETARISKVHFYDEALGFGISGRSILKTIDGGISWATIFYSNRATNLNVIVPHSFDKITSVGNEGVIISSSDLGLTWQHIDKKYFGGIINDIHFLNNYLGYLINLSGSNRLYRTTDGGSNWLQTEISGLISLDFIENLGWAVGSNGKILHTTDSGYNWNSQNSGTVNNLRDVKFVNERVGWVAGEFATILKTLDGGATWIVQDNPASGTLNKIIHQNPLKVWIYGRLKSIYTTNGGFTWALLEPTTSFYPAFFLIPEIGWARKRDTLYRTTDGGISWQKISQATINITGTCFKDLTTGWSLFSGYLSKTTDGGFNWLSDLGVGIGYSLQNLFLSSTKSLWVVGLGGAVLKYNIIDSTVSVNEESTSINNKSSLFVEQNYPNPFNLNTRIKYKTNEVGHIAVILYDILGLQLKILENGLKIPGSYIVEWDGRNRKGFSYPSGVYFLSFTFIPKNRLKPINNKVIKMIYLK